MQRDVMTYLSRCGSFGGPVCSTTKAPELRGYDLEQVERALAGLLRRKIIRRESIRYIVND